MTPSEQIGALAEAAHRRPTELDYIELCNAAIYHATKLEQAQATIKSLKEAGQALYEIVWAYKAKTGRAYLDEWQQAVEGEE